MAFIVIGFVELLIAENILSGSSDAYKSSYKTILARIQSPWSFFLLTGIAE